MSGSAITMMIIVCVLVWGGFIAFLGIVWKCEKRRARSRIERDTGNIENEPGR
jgi:heme/copper-type cytochrome/quinol oxidase subunit 2